MQSMQSIIGCETHWVFNFRRQLRGWEVNELDWLRSILATAPKLNMDKDDRLTWIVEPSEEFTVRSKYDW